MNRWEDFLESKRPYIRHYPVQEMLYCPALKANGFDVNDEVHILFLKEPLSGEKHQVEIFHDDLYTQRILKGLKKVDSYVANGANEQPEWKDACQYCEFGELCFTREAILKQGLPVIDNEEAERKLDRCGQIKAYRDEYEELMKEIKDQFRGENVIIGDWKIVSTSYQATIYSVPKEIQVQYQSTAPRVRMNIVPLIKAL